MPKHFHFLSLALASVSLIHCSGSNGGGDDAGHGARAGAAGTVSGAAGTAVATGGSSGGKSGGAGGAGSPATGGASTAGVTATGGAGAGASNSAAGGMAGSAGAMGPAGGVPATGGTGGTAAGRGGEDNGAGMGGRGAGGTGGKAGGGGAGASGSTLPFSFYIGADITDQEPQSDSTRASLLTLMKSHGFNFVRLRTFVDPKASDGYDKQNGYDDLAHTVSFGKQIKDAAMGLLVDFHYSDNWADPGKQCVPIAWQSLTTIDDMATAVHDYTKDAIEKLIAGGARPDMVQIGNETTPGMLLHRCDGGGQPTGTNSVNGSTSNWKNLGLLLKAGAN
ncbi:MAG TPA: glycosyl hydrolase 53 family protein, partial [Polyangiaceae bacterium]|nr:glycosyl hydrolase 53 family protein [Polyangiaceae bacterium]